MWKPREACQKFRHYGLQRSGTYYLEGLMYRYFEVWCRNGGSGPKWKHSLEMAPLEEDIFYLAIAKNPYLWIESIAYRSPMDYIKRQTLYPAQEKGCNVGKHNINIVNAAKTWNHFYQNWASQSKEKVYLMRYEDLLKDRDSILSEIQMKFGLERRENPLSYKTKETTILDKNMDSSKRKYYQNEKPQYLTEDHIDLITQNIDADLLSFFEYVPFINKGKQ